MQELARNIEIFNFLLTQKVLDEIFNFLLTQKVLDKKYISKVVNYLSIFFSKHTVKNKVIKIALNGEKH